MAMVFCRGCGKEIHDSAPVCPSCGAVQIQQQGQPASASDRRILPAFLLCFFFGIFGAHRFYAGKAGTAVAQLLTIGGLGVWALVDLILLACGAFTDGSGNRMTAWT
ncbi:MAG TPA: TM2 domain-containing protein [Candidatus Angelobacter sp.]|nr:TM2 domain-containing protein [Candidatus Angelobacter sp.]